MKTLTPLLNWYSTLSPQTLQYAQLFYAPTARFKDPFNDVVGLTAIEAIFEHMFATTENPRFVIGEQIVQHQQAFVTWTFEFSLNGKPYQIVGGSHLIFNDEGMVTLHRDYWDAAEELLQKLPIVGAPIRWLRGKFAVKFHKKNKSDLLIKLSQIEHLKDLRLTAYFNQYPWCSLKMPISNNM